MKRSSVLILGMILAAAIPCAAQGKPAKQDKDSAAAKAPAKQDTKPGTALPAAGSDDPNYVIGPEDVVDISVWKETEVSRTVPVRPDGKISLPLLNDVQAAGLTPTQLAEQLTEKLRKYFTEPQVTVIVTAINSRRIYITGEVNHAGAFPMLPNMTVLQALASTGGFTQFANQSKIYVLRSENGKQVKFPFDYKKVIRGQNAEQNILLKPGDTIVVP